MEQSEKIGVYSVGFNLFLVGIKCLLAYFSGSVAIFADAIHSSTDVISSATVLAGIKLSKRKSKTFPYGLYKVENFVSLVSAALIFVAGYEIVRTVFLRPESLQVRFLPHAIAGMVVVAGVTFAFSRYELNQGKALESPSLIADAQHIRTDMFSTAVIVAGLAGGVFGFALDKPAAVVIVVLIFKAGVVIFVDAIRVLLDASLDFDTMDRVKSIILKDPQVISINALLGRNSGPFKFIEADIVVRATNLDKAHFVSRRVEQEIRNQVKHVDRVVIHYEPRKKDTNTCAVPLEADRHTVSEHFGEASYFYVVTLSRHRGELLSEAYFNNPFAGTDKGKGIKVSEWLLERGVDTVYALTDLKGKGPGYVFSDADVDVVVAEGRSMEDVRRQLRIRFDSENVQGNSS